MPSQFFVLFLLVWATHSIETTSSSPILHLSVPPQVFIATGKPLTANCSTLLNSPHKGSVGLTWSYQDRTLSTGNGSAILHIHHVTKNQSGIYLCTAVSGAKARRVLDAVSFAASVGDPPAKPSQPTAHHFYGFPTKDGALSYNQTQALPGKTPQGVTYQLFLSPNSCYRYYSKKYMHIAHACTSVQHESEAREVTCDVSEHLQRCDWSTDMDCSPFVGCTHLAGFVRASNKFGHTDSKLGNWRLRRLSSCGWPSNLRAINIQEESITLSWDTPIALVNSTASLIRFKVVCKPSDCGNLEPYEPEIQDGHWDYTVRSLNVDTKYELRVYCRIDYEHFTESGPYASICVQTAEGVPKSQLIIRDFHQTTVDQEKRNIRIVWEPLARTSLRGRFLNYNITYWASSDPKSEMISKEIYDNVTSYVMESVDRYSNITFRISVCNRAGCSTPTIYTVAPDVYPSIKAVHGGQPRVQSMGTVLVVIGVIAGIVFIAIVGFIIYQAYKRRKKWQASRRPLPPLPPPLTPEEQETQGSSEYCEAKVPGISRTSSNNTCSTEL